MEHLHFYTIFGTKATENTTNKKYEKHFLGAVKRKTQKGTKQWWNDNKMELEIDRKQNLEKILWIFNLMRKINFWANSGRQREWTSGLALWFECIERMLPHYEQYTNPSIERYLYRLPSIQWLMIKMLIIFEYKSSNLFIFIIFPNFSQIIKFRWNYTSNFEVVVYLMALWLDNASSSYYSRPSLFIWIIFGVVQKSANIILSKL